MRRLLIGTRVLGFLWLEAVRIPARLLWNSVTPRPPLATALAYLGDDLTDKGAFRTIGRHGLRILVRPEPRLSATDLWLCPPLLTCFTDGKR